MKRSNLDHLNVQAPRSGGRLKRAIIYPLAIVMGLVVGVLIYLWMLLGVMGFSDIAVKDAASGSLVNRGAARDSNLNVAGIYNPEEFPINYVKPLSKDVTNILVFGLDERDPEGKSGPSRTDSMIIMSLDRKNKAIKLSSLLRDIQADIKGREGAADKLNAAYVHGGVGMLINTINEMFNLDIQNFVKFDFWSAAKFIDAAGGVTVEVTPEELEYVNISVREQSTLAGVKADILAAAGTQRLSGMQAIAWARIRAIGNDQGRTSRQRTVMMNMLKSFSEQGLTTKLTALRSALPYATTNISRSQMLLLGVTNFQCLRNIAEYRVPEDSMYRTDQSNYNIIVDMDLQKPALHEFIYKKVVN